jgi:hypothetical protein
LSYLLVLNAEETRLVREYALEDHVLTWRIVDGERRPDDTIASMVEGRAATTSDITALVHNENVIKRACDELPVLFELVRSFGGDEVIDYPRAAAATVDVKGRWRRRESA